MLSPAENIVQDLHGHFPRGVARPWASLLWKSSVTSRRDEGDEEGTVKFSQVLMEPNALINTLRRSPTIPASAFRVQPSLCRVKGMYSCAMLE